MTRVLILVPDLFPNDAVGNDALGMAAALRNSGRQAVFVCNHAERDIIFTKATELLKNERLHSSAEDLLIYHYAVEWPEGDEIFQRFPGTRILRYHNVTPPEFLRPWNPVIADFCSRGRDRLKKLAIPHLLLADSEENLKDFLALTGLKQIPVRILPPFHRAEALAAVDSDPLLDSLLRACPWPKFLHVGRISPHKNLAALIEDLDNSLLEINREDHEQRASRATPPGPGQARRISWDGIQERSMMERPVEHRCGLSPSGVATGPVLYVVGSFSHHFKNYNSRVLNAARHARILRVRFLSRVKESALAALYRGCDLFVTRSLHEGFFVPIVEAAACGLPMLLPDTPIFHETAGEMALFTDRIDPISLRRGLNAKEISRKSAMSAFVQDRFATTVLERGLIDAISQLHPRA